MTNGVQFQIIRLWGDLVKLRVDLVELWGDLVELWGDLVKLWGVVGPRRGLRGWLSRAIRKS